MLGGSVAKGMAPAQGGTRHHTQLPQRLGRQAQTQGAGGRIGRLPAIVQLQRTAALAEGIGLQMHLRQFGEGLQTQTALLDPIGQLAEGLGGAGVVVRRQAVVGAENRQVAACLHPVPAISQARLEADGSEGPRAGAVGLGQRAQATDQAVALFATVVLIGRHLLVTGAGIGQVDHVLHVTLQDGRAQGGRRTGIPSRPGVQSLLYPDGRSTLLVALLLDRPAACTESANREAVNATVNTAGLLPERFTSSSP